MLYRFDYCTLIFSPASNELYSFFHTIFRYGISSPAKNADAAAADAIGLLPWAVSLLPGK